MTVGVFVSRDFSPVYRPRMELHLLVMLSDSEASPAKREYDLHRFE